MKIAMIGHKEFPSRLGGVEVVVYELATRLTKRGHHISVYNRGRQKGHNHYMAEGVACYRCFTVKKQALNALIYSVTATLKALCHSDDILHFHALGPSAMIILPKLFGRKTVATVHGLDWQRAKWNRAGVAYLKYGERILARYADEVIVLSRNVQEYFKNTYGRDTILIENAIEPVTQRAPKQITEKFGLGNRDYILFLARIVPEKGLHYLIEAYLNCKTEKKLVIAGTVPDNAYGRQIQEMAGNSDRIIFTGFVQGELLDELYSCCSFYVLPSEIEGLALTLLEAMSAGARCLTSNIPENTAVTGDFGSSFISGDAESLTEACRRLLAEPDENPRAEEQMEMIRRKYSYDRMILQTEQVYEKVRKV